jgi:ribosome biogenesis GTPase
MQGRVIKSTGSWYNVLLEDKSIIQCRMVGKYRLVSRRTSNPVVIGDIVEVEREDSSANGSIKNVLPRNNYIIRQSSRNRTAEHILAANLDQALLITTLSQPRTSTGFIDRFLVTATAYHIPTVIVFNKADIYSEEEKKLLNEFIAIYTGAGYKTIITSALEDLHITEVKELMTGRITLLAGHSGVGKSTLINKIDPALNLKTGEISAYHNKGTHTTTFAEMFELPFGGFIIDTPGIKEFGILDFKPEEVSHYFPEMEKLLDKCQFNNCLHINEPNCAVKEAVRNDEISRSRYNNYLGIINEIKTEEKIYD